MNLWRASQVWLRVVMPRFEQERHWTGTQQQMLL